MSDTCCRKKSKPKTILIRRAPQEAKNIFHNKDCTPKPLNPVLFQRHKECILSTTKSSASFKSGSGQSSASKVQLQDNLLGQLQGSFGPESTILDDELLVESSPSSPGYAVGGDLDKSVDQAPAVRRKLILKETETEIILDLSSCAVLKDSEEAEEVLKDNEAYEFLTQGKGRYRKRGIAAIQTLPVLQKTRGTEASLVKNFEVATFVSEWEMYDTFHKPTEEETSSFFESACVVERILANNYFNKQQKRFRNSNSQENNDLNREYLYKLQLLWTFSHESTQNLSVTSMQFNPKNPDLLAVGLGKFFFDDPDQGAILIYNIKNPVQPERQFPFQNAVTTLQFSSTMPDILAVGLYNGQVLLLNIISRTSNIIAQSAPSFEPVWDLQVHDNEMWACLNDGRIILYKMLHQNTNFQFEEIMRVLKTDGKLRGISTINKSCDIDVPILRFCPAKTLWKCEDSHIYYICSGEGVIFKCSTNYYHRHLDCYQAHQGQINDFKISPFSRRISVSCGDDWFVRLWATEIEEPLLELSLNMKSVGGVAFSPTHPTILVSLHGTEIVLWDLQRKIYEPQSIFENPAKIQCTKVQFTQNGNCLIVGDLGGNVHVFALEDMPFAPCFPENLLFQALEKMLVTKPDLIAKLRTKNVF